MVHLGSAKLRRVALTAILALGWAAVAPTAWALPGTTGQPTGAGSEASARAVVAHQPNPRAHSKPHWARHRHHHPRPPVINRAPLAPTNVQFSEPIAPCASGPDRPAVRSATPTLNAAVSDPDGGHVAADVTVYAVGTASPVLWQRTTTGQFSGALHSLTLGGLSDGGSYRIEVKGVDSSGRTGPAVTCEIDVDLVSPAAPTVIPVTGTSQPVYAADTTAGGVGQTGSFTFVNGGSPDVTRYRYSFNGSALDQVATPESPTITFTPTSAGPQTLEYQAVDRAGWTSDVQVHRFRVGFPATIAWNLNEAAGEIAASSGPAGDAYPLTLSASIARGNGPLADFGVDSSDLALVFASPEDTARTTGAVTSTKASFSVSAVVKADTSTVMTAVSQDGSTRSGFELGTRPCASGDAVCWAFAMPESDSADSAVSTVVSQTVVEPGKWALLAGVHDSTEGALRLWVCTIGEDENDMVPYRSADVAFGAGWDAAGPLRLGRGQGGGAAMWSGSISDLKVAHGVITDSAVRRACSSGTS